MMVFRPGDRIPVAAAQKGARLMILGGAALSGPRYIWWNFVASSGERMPALSSAERMAEIVLGFNSSPHPSCLQFRFSYA